MLALKLAACLLWAACLQLTVAQDNPTALTMAQTLINGTYLRLITTGSRKPSFTGPKGSSKLITYWARGANVEKKLMPAGAVKLITPTNDAAVTLRFSAYVKVRLFVILWRSCSLVCGRSYSWVSNSRCDLSFDKPDVFHCKIINSDVLHLIFERQHTFICICSRVFVPHRHAPLLFRMDTTHFVTKLTCRG
jgi:hypothetical protein